MDYIPVNKMETRFNFIELSNLFNEFEQLFSKSKGCKYDLVINIVKRRNELSSKLFNNCCELIALSDSFEWVNKSKTVKNNDKLSQIVCNAIDFYNDLNNEARKNGFGSIAKYVQKVNEE